MRRIDISSVGLHTTLDLDNEEAVRGYVTMLHDELSRLRASLASTESSLAIAVGALEGTRGWLRLVEIRGIGKDGASVEDLQKLQAEIDTALAQVRSKP